MSSCCHSKNEGVVAFCSFCKPRPRMSHVEHTLGQTQNHAEWLLEERMLHCRAAPNDRTAKEADVTLGSRILWIHIAP